MATKWTILVERQAEAQRQADLLAHQLEGLDNTPCGLKCGGCGTLLVTEGDFARHFTIPDPRFLNLGNCPEKD